MNSLDMLELASQLAQVAAKYVGLLQLVVQLLGGILAVRRTLRQQVPHRRGRSHLRSWRPRRDR